MNFRKTLQLLILLISAQYTLADNPNIINYHRTQYNAANKNWSISSDNIGVMYFGNDKGLLEFDGIKWKLNKNKKAEVVRAVLATSNKTIFSGGYEEFGRWDRGVSGKLNYTSLSDSLPQNSMHNDDIWKIVEHNGKIYFQSFGGIYVYDYKTVKKIATTKNYLFLFKIYNELWAQELGGAIFRISENKQEEIAGSRLFSNTEVKAILPYKENHYLIATSNMGIYIYNGISFSLLNSSNELINNEINSAIRTSNGNYFIGTILNGVYVVNELGQIIKHINSDVYLQNNTVLDIFEDRVNNVWVALDRGIARIQYVKNISFYTDQIGKLGAVYTAALFNNKLFIGTNQGLFYLEINQNGQIPNLSQVKKTSSINGQVWELKIIGDKLYCGHNKGLSILDKNLNTTHENAINTGVFRIVQKDNILLLGTYTSLQTLNLTTNKVHSLSNINEPITNIEIDHMNNVWIEHMNKGVYKCRISPEYDQIESYLYFGKQTTGHAPYKFKLFRIGGRALFLGNDKFFTYNDIDRSIVGERTLNNCFEGIKDLRSTSKINQSNFWILGNNVIYKLYYNGDRAEIKEKIDIAYRDLSLVDGFENIVQLNDSLSFICLDNGFLLHHGTEPALHPLNIPYLKSVETQDINGEIRYTSIEHLGKIKNQFNNIKISFASKDLFVSNIYFQYKLEGLNNEWTAPEIISEVNLDRLPKGKYTFHVRAVDRLGNYSEAKKYSFEILPPWYETIWAITGFTILIFATIAATTLLIVRYYKNKHMKELREQEEKLLRSQNIELHQQVEEKNAELLSQTSFIIQKNELIFKVKNEVDTFQEKHNSKQLAPLFLKINTLLNNNLDVDADWKMFLIKFEHKHTNFFKNLKNQYPQLTANDMKFCACLKLNLDSKEIASLMNISVRAVENSRYRIRKKLNIPTNQNLNDFFLNF